MSNVKFFFLTDIPERIGALLEDFNRLIGVEIELMRCWESSAFPSDKPTADTLFRTAADWLENECDPSALRNTAVLVYWAEKSRKDYYIDKTSPLFASKGEGQFSAAIAMLILSFPEIHWIFLTRHKYDTQGPFRHHAHNLDPKTFDELRRLANVPRSGFTYLFDPTGLRAILQGNCGLPQRSKLSLAVDEEQDFALLHGYIAFANGLRCQTISTFVQWQTAEAMAKLPKELAYPVVFKPELLLTIEDANLRFPDTPDSETESNLWYWNKRFAPRRLASNAVRLAITCNQTPSGRQPSGASPGANPVPWDAGQPPKLILPKPHVGVLCLSDHIAFIARHSETAETNNQTSASAGMSTREVANKERGTRAWRRRHLGVGRRISYRVTPDRRNIFDETVEEQFAAACRANQQIARLPGIVVLLLTICFCVAAGTFSTDWQIGKLSFPFVLFWSASIWLTSLFVYWLIRDALDSQTHRLFKTPKIVIDVGSYLSPYNSADSTAHQYKSGERHSAEPRLHAIAERLVNRSRKILSVGNSVPEMIHAAILALEAEEYLRRRTPTLMMQALILRHQAEVRAECLFPGVSYQKEVVKRSARLKVEASRIAEVVDPSNREVMMLSIQSQTLNAILACYRNSGQIAEEFETLNAIRHVERELALARFKQEKARANRALYWVRRYFETVLGEGLPAIGFAVLLVLLSGMTAYAFFARSETSDTWTVLLQAFTDSISAVVSTQPPQDANDLTRRHWMLLPLTWMFIVLGIFHIGILVSHVYTRLSRR